MLNGRLEFRLLNKPSLLPGGSYLSIYFKEFSSLFIAPQFFFFFFATDGTFCGIRLLILPDRVFFFALIGEAGVIHSLSFTLTHPTVACQLSNTRMIFYILPSSLRLLCCVVLCSTIIIVIIIIIINVVFLLDLLDDTLTRKRRTVLFLGTTHTRDFVPFVLPV